MARFFIDRPIFAWVIAIILMLAGILALRGLPVERYPDIAPPQVSISRPPGTSSLAKRAISGACHLRSMWNSASQQISASKRWSDSKSSMRP